MSIANPDPLLTTDEAAKYLDHSRVTLEFWRRRGQGPVYRVLGTKSIRYLKSDLDRFIDASAVLPKDQAMNG